ncbi:type I toxin-antitoxin system Fst family toxin [Carnobacterium sp.]
MIVDLKLCNRTVGIVIELFSHWLEEKDKDND